MNQQREGISSPFLIEKFLYKNRVIQPIGCLHRSFSDLKITNISNCVLLIYNISYHFVRKVDYEIDISVLSSPRLDYFERNYFC